MADHRDSTLLAFLLGFVLAALVVGGGTAGWMHQRRAKALADFESDRRADAELMAGTMVPFEAARRAAADAARRADAAEAALKNAKEPK